MEGRISRYGGRRTEHLVGEPGISAEERRACDRRYCDTGSGSSRAGIRGASGGPSGNERTTANASARRGLLIRPVERRNICKAAESGGSASRIRGQGLRERNLERARRQ